MTSDIADLVTRLRTDAAFLAKSGFSTAHVISKDCNEAATALEAVGRERDARQEDSDSYKASMKEYFEQSLSEHNAKVEAHRALSTANAEVERLTRERDEAQALARFNAEQWANLAARRKLDIAAEARPALQQEDALK